MFPFTVSVSITFRMQGCCHVVHVSRFVSSVRLWSASHMVQVVRPKNKRGKKKERRDKRKGLLVLFVLTCVVHVIAWCFCLVFLCFKSPVQVQWSFLAFLFVFYPFFFVAFFYDFLFFSLCTCVTFPILAGTFQQRVLGTLSFVSGLIYWSLRGPLLLHSISFGDVLLLCTDNSALFSHC